MALTWEKFVEKWAANTAIINAKYPPSGLTPVSLDGATDDTTSLQAVIDYAHDNGGGVCYVPKGTLIASAITLKSNVTLMGAGKNVTILKLKNGTNQDFIKNAANTDTFYGIKNLTVDGNYAQQSGGAGILFTGDDVTIDNCEVKNCKTYGVLLCDGNRHSIANCFIHHNKNIGLFIGSANTTIYDVSIISNTIDNNDSHGILIGNTAVTVAVMVHVIDCLLSNNGANDVGGGGVWAVTGSFDVIISGCTVYNNDGDNIGIAGCTGYTVANNNTFGADGPTWDPVNSGIAISASSTHGIVTGVIPIRRVASLYGVQPTVFWWHRITVITIHSTRQMNGRAYRSIQFPLMLTAATMSLSKQTYVLTIRVQKRNLMELKLMQTLIMLFVKTIRFPGT